jgi:hypothetical protein
MNDVPCSLSRSLVLTTGLCAKGTVVGKKSFFKGVYCEKYAE